MEPVEVDRRGKMKRERLRVTAFVIAVLIASTAAYLLTSSDTGRTVNITSISVYIGYSSYSDSYFGAPVHNVTANYETYGAGQSVVFSIPFHNSGSSNHSVNTIFTKQSGFLVTSENPGLPVNVSPGSTSYINVRIQTPNANFAGNLAIYAVVS